jgi:two-component system sensor histidine kinase YesM
MITPYQEVDNSVMILKTELTVMFAVIILILFLMSKYSANNMAQPIILLSQMMDAYHGKEQASLPVSPALYEKRTDEIGQMYRSYKQMMERIETLTQEIYIKNLEKKDAELALLQSQINPHFLYNTLDSINWLALANDQDEISEMITALSDTFRLSLMKSNSSFVEIEHEIQYIKSYLILQEFRYGKRLKYAFALPDPLPKLLIPRFILQPVVENALKHGIDSLEKGGHICIKLTCSTQLIITVINDGTAINLEQMNALLRFDPKGPDILSFQKGGYGVQNIHRRIKIICGDEYGLSYETTDTQTICKITLPRKEQEEISSL